MPTVREAVSSMGIEDREDARVCIVNFTRGGKTHGTLDVFGERDVASLGTCYVATGRYLPGSIHAGGGREAANLVDVVAIPFDFDLSPYLGMQNKAELYATPAPIIDGYIDALAEEVKNALALHAIPLSRLICTGYGVLALSLVSPSQMARVAELRALNRELVNQINRGYGGELADSIVKDAGTRIVRIPGSLNVKGVAPREAWLMERHDAYIDLGNFPAMDTTYEARVYAQGTESLPEGRVEQIVSAIRDVHHEGARHGIILGLAGMFLKSGVMLEQAIDIVERIAHDDPELTDRIRAVETTYHRATQGASVAGFTQLGGLIPGDALRAVDAGLADLYRANQHSMELIRTGEVSGGAATHGEPENRTQGWTTRAVLPPPESVYRGWLRDYVTLMSPCTEAPPQFHLATALTMMSVMIGRKAWAYQAERNYPMLYSILVGETGGSKKDTAVNMGEGLFIGRNQEGVWHVPFSTMYNVDTSQGLINQLVENPVRLSVNKEFARVLDQSRQEFAINLLRQLTQLWDASPVENTRANNPQRVENPTFGLLGCVTPQELADTMARKEILNGFANRVLFVYGSGRGILDDPPPPDPAMMRGLIDRLRGYVAQLPRGNGEFPKTRDARDWWRETYRTMKLTPYPTETAALLGQRVGSNTFRVALCYAVSEGADVICQAHLEAAHAWVTWCYHNTIEHAETWGASEDARLANRIIDAVAASGILSKSDIHRLVGRDFAPSKLVKELRALDELGVLRIDGGGNVNGVIYDRHGSENGSKEVESDEDARPLLPGKRHDPRFDA